MPLAWSGHAGIIRRAVYLALLALLQDSVGILGQIAASWLNITVVIIAEPNSSLI